MLLVQAFKLSNFAVATPGRSSQVADSRRRVAGRFTEGMFTAVEGQEPSLLCHWPASRIQLWMFHGLDTLLEAGEMCQTPLFLQMMFSLWLLPFFQKERRKKERKNRKKERKKEGRKERKKERKKERANTKNYIHGNKGTLQKRKRKQVAWVSRPKVQLVWMSDSCAPLNLVWYHMERPSATLWVNRLTHWCCKSCLQYALGQALMLWSRRCTARPTNPEDLLMAKVLRFEWLRCFLQRKWESQTPDPERWKQRSSTRYLTSIASIHFHASGAWKS